MESWKEGIHASLINNEGRSHSGVYLQAYCMQEIKGKSLYLALVCPVLHKVLEENYG